MSVIHWENGVWHMGKLGFVRGETPVLLSHRLSGADHIGASITAAFG